MLIIKKKISKEKKKEKEKKKGEGKEKEKDVRTSQRSYVRLLPVERIAHFRTMENVILNQFIQNKSVTKTGKEAMKTKKEKKRK